MLKKQNQTAGAGSIETAQNEGFVFVFISNGGRFNPIEETNSYS